jgi:hypothetical protein
MVEGHNVWIGCEDFCRHLSKFTKLAKFIVITNEFCFVAALDKNLRIMSGNAASFEQYCAQLFVLWQNAVDFLKIYLLAS